MGNPMDLFSLDGKVALVTGAGSGLGRQFSEVMAEAGADVACADIDEESAKAAAAVVEGLGRRGTAIGCDVTAEAEVEAMVTRTVEVLGRLDILFNNAGVGFPRKVEDITVAIWERELDVHAKGVFLGTRSAIPAMRKGGGGSIVNTSSVMGIVGSPTSPAYSAAKGAITIFTKSAALQYAKENIRINSVHPGYADTPLTEQRFNDPAVRQALIDRTPMGRLGTADDIANGVLFLASDESSWVTGSELVIDGGMTAQ